MYFPFKLHTASCARRVNTGSVSRVTGLPASSRFSDLNVSTSSGERVTRPNPPATLRDYLTPRQCRARAAHFRIYAERTHTHEASSIPNTPNRHSRDHFALAWSKTIRTNPRRRSNAVATITFPSCNVPERDLFARRSHCDRCHRQQTLYRRSSLDRKDRARCHFSLAWEGSPYSPPSLCPIRTNQQHQTPLGSYRTCRTLTCCQNWASRYMRSFLKSQSIDCMACISSELASAEACMLANAAEFRLARMGCWSAAVTTEVLLPATRLAWYKVAAGASSEPPVASSWAPIGAEGPWSPSDEATLTASSFSGGPKTALPRLAPPPPPPPPPPLPIAIGEHVLGGGSDGTVFHRQSTARSAKCGTRPLDSLHFRVIAARSTLPGWHSNVAPRTLDFHEFPSRKLSPAALCVCTPRVWYNYHSHSTYMYLSV